MDSAHRIHRTKPTTSIPLAERIDSVEFIDSALARYAESIGIRRHGSLFQTDSAASASSPVEVLAALTNLHAQVLAAFQTFGLSAVSDAALYELTNLHTPAGAVRRHEPDYSLALKRIYPDL